MNEGQKFKVGDLVKLEGWDDYRPIESINGEYICFVNAELFQQWYNTFKHKFIKYVEKENEMQNTESKKDMQENKTEDTFKVGDTVWCVLYGKGEVTFVSENAEYPVEVCFVNGEAEWYTIDGRYAEEYQRTLFFSEPKIEALTTRPFTPALIGKSVLIVAEHGAKYAIDVQGECKESLTDERDKKYYKNSIKELYILGENVVNSIK